MMAPAIVYPCGETGCSAARYSCSATSKSSATPSGASVPSTNDPSPGKNTSGRGPPGTASEPSQPVANTIESM
ncbi:hypothetical protein PICSAR10_04435 [Mycobacterium avium subsp. paratuberculosis]|nr:hypothetical protein PICSAR10_04435 [Mycobacterium avium subsp. paratuberculosis]